MAALPTGTVTFLFTDIEGSTRLLQHLGDRYADALTQYRLLLRSAVQELTKALLSRNALSFRVEFEIHP